MTGRLGALLLRAAPCACLLVSAAGAAAAADFLVPGVSLSSVSFEEGVGVWYLVVTESEGIGDTAMVALEVLAVENGEVELEIVSAPFPPLPEETVTIRVTMAKTVAAARTRDELRAGIRRVLVREGTGEFREPTGEELDEFELERVFIKRSEDARETLLPDERVETPAGSFECDVREYLEESKRIVSLGGVKGEKIETNRSTLWISGEVPFWGLVRSRVERSAMTRIRGDNPFGEPRPRSSVTESILHRYHAACP